MKKLKLILLTSIALFSLNANAGKVGILDVEKIVKESQAMKDIQNKISVRQEDYQKEVDAKQKALEDEQKRIEGKKNILSKEAIEKELKAFDKKVDDLKNFVDKKQNSLKKATMDGMGKVNDKIKDIITDLAKEQDFDVIIPAAQAFFFRDELDVSDEVLARLNKKITKVDLKFE